jgi:hypothetical protein
MLFKNPNIPTQPEVISNMQKQEVNESMQDWNYNECYNLNEVQDKYSISETALQNLIKRNQIPKIKKGWYAYVPKKVIDKLLS